MCKVMSCISVFIHIEIQSNCSKKYFALSLTLKKKLKGTRKWSICFPFLHKELLRKCVDLYFQVTFQSSCMMNLAASAMILEEVKFY